MTHVGRLYRWIALLGLLVTACVGPLRMPQRPAVEEDESRRQAMQYFIRAKVFESEGNYLGAIVALRNAADLDDKSPTIYAQLAYDYRRIDDLQMAVHFAQKGLELAPDDTRLRRFLIELSERRGERRFAIEQIEELLEYERTNWSLYRHLAYLYLETGQAERITPLFEKIIDKEEVSAEVKVDIASIFNSIGKREHAEEIYRKILAKDPQVEDAWLGLAELRLSQGQRAEGMQVYRRAARQLPNSLLATYYLARLIISEHDLEEIITEEEPGLLYRLGVTLSDAGKFDLAALLFKRIVSMQPDSLEGWLDLARYYIYLGDQVQLNKVLQQATTAMPDSSEVYLFWGTALEREGQFDRAIAVYQQGLQRLPASTELYLYWGIALEQQEQWSEAIALYERALVAVGPHAVLEVRWGICLGQKREWQEAQSHYRAAVALDAGNREAHLHWGIALERLERWPEAIEQLRAAAALDRGDTQVLFYLGSCYEQASRHLDDSDYFAHAVETFTRLLAIKSDDAFALNYLGYMYAEKGIQLQEAVDLLLRAIDIEPENSAFFDSLGWAYYRLGEWQQAERYLTKALEYMDGDDTEEQTVILDHAGDIAWALGKQSVANTYWQRVLDLTPDDEAVRAKVGR